MGSRGKTKSATIKDFTLTSSIVLSECAGHSPLATFLAHHSMPICTRIANRTWSTCINVCENTSCIHTCQCNDGSELLVAEICVPKISWLLDGHEYTIQDSTATWQPTQSFNAHYHLICLSASIKPLSENSFAFMCYGNNCRLFNSIYMAASSD